jgi:hypothetical protein
MPYKYTLAIASAVLVDAGDPVIDGGEHETGQLDGFVFALIATKGSATALDMKIQDSFDGGTTWFDVPLAANPQLSTGGDFTQLTANGNEVLCPIRPLGHLVRASRTSTGNGWSYTLTACCNPKN